MFALVDGNSFYASCEAVFRPDLEGRPIVVLSNNDGCIVAANQQAKSFGNIMYQPYFQLAKMLEKQDTAVFSSNYELYGDLSCRMHALLGTFAPRQEIYSIDESFLDFRGMHHWDFMAYGQEIKQTMLKQLGLPVAVGIGSSKTLAKAANNRAKKIKVFDGVLALSDLSEAEQNKLLSGMDVADVWGVGRQWTKRLNSMGITTALHLKQMPAKKVRAQFGIVLERTVHELNGIPCQDMELIAPDKQEIVSSRAFSQPVTHYKNMQQAVARYIARAAEKLRNQKGSCKRVSVGITTNPFKSSTAQYHNWATTSLIYPSSHTGHLIERGKHCLDRIWEEGFEYKKAFVMLSDISDADIIQYDLFARQPKYSDSIKASALMHVLDKINTRMGKGVCRLASEGLDGQISWPMKRHKQSPRYSTCWKELPVVFIK
ncbi:MAG: Y-family DNA polymerase [Gammaproteobacteria bacterium]|nr:Y-family DNA polymerase [Gammaproteobacteria bacterium]